MKKFIIVAFSYVVIGCGSIYASNISISNQDAHMKLMQKTEESGLKEVARKVNEQADSLSKDVNEIVSECSNKTVKDLVKTAFEIRDNIFLLERSIPIDIQLSFMDSVDDVLNRAYDLQDLVENDKNRRQMLKDDLCAKAKKLQDVAGTLEKQIRVLPLNLSPAEAAKAKELYRRISGMSFDKVEKYIMASERNIIHFFGSTKRFKEILLLGDTPTQNEQNNLDLFWVNVAKKTSYDDMLSIIACPVFKLGIRSFMSHLICVCEKNRKAGTADAMNKLEDIFRGEDVCGLPVDVPTGSEATSGSTTSSQLLSGSVESLPSDVPASMSAVTPNLEEEFAQQLLNLRQKLQESAQLQEPERTLELNELEQKLLKLMKKKPDQKLQESTKKLLCELVHGLEQELDQPEAILKLRKLKQMI